MTFNSSVRSVAFNQIKNNLAAAGLFDGSIHIVDID
jgi:hypothetical protein